MKGIAVDEEANLAWALAEAVKPHLSTVERHHIYVAIGVGETFAAIGCLIASAASERIALPADLVERCTRLLDVYAGHEDERYLRGIVEYVLPPETPGTPKFGFGRGPHAHRRWVLQGEIAELLDTTEPVVKHSCAAFAVKASAAQMEGNLSMTSEKEIVAGLAEIIEEVTGIEPSEVTVEMSFVDDLDLDSLSAIGIAMQTEDKYGVKIPDEDLAGLRTVGDVVDYIQRMEKCASYGDH